MKEKVDYQFIAVPYKAAYACDALCLAVFDSIGETVPS